MVNDVKTGVKMVETSIDMERLGNFISEMGKVSKKYGFKVSKINEVSNKVFKLVFEG